MNKLPATFGKDKRTIHVVIETPCKNRNKYAFDEETGLFKLKKVLPFGLAFPFSFGFIPGTKGEDGDPLDVLLLMDELTYPGCFMECRLVGVIIANQKEKHRKSERNDRLIAIPVEMKDMDHIQELSDMNKRRLEDIIRFFEYYNATEDVEFIFKRAGSAKKAFRLVEKSVI